MSADQDEPADEKTSVEPSNTSVEPAAQKTALVVRSTVEPGKPYETYRQVLRYDFIHSCAYCTMTEAEATAIRFTIDHYEPQVSRPDLANAYDNLMYACDSCNMRKGVRSPPAEARAAGHRFFRPDEDHREDHFKLSDLRVEAVSNTGAYSIDALDLNRLNLQKIRKIRRRLRNCDELIEAGVLALIKLPIDRLPPDVRGKTYGEIKQALTLVDEMEGEIDSLLRQFARSELIDPDQETGKRGKERLARLKATEALFPGAWSKRRKARKRR